MGTLLVRLFAGSFFRDAEGAVKSGWQWLFSSVTHILEALLLVAMLFGLYERHELHKTEKALHSCDVGRQADQADWALQVKNTKAATAAATQKGKEASSDTETYHTQLQADNRGLRDYVATHRLHQPVPRPDPAPSPGSGDDSAVHESAPTVPTVAVPKSVLDTCDADYTYAASAYELGQHLIQQGLAEPQK